MPLMSWSMFLFSSIPLYLFMLTFTNKLFISIEIPLISIMSFNISISFILDWMSSLFMFTVMFISSSILLFSSSYIPKNEQKLFFLLLMMFISSMLVLIMSDNLIFILLGWDGLGFSSYILITFYQNSSSSSSGSLTLLSNRIGDVSILISIAIMTSMMNWNFHMNNNFPMMLMILLMLSACTKSAQFPFCAWLPAAMAAPTPISALVHSSTLVTAGVFLLIRTMDLNHNISLIIMSSISVTTIILSSMAANWEQDMKKIIALSTLSQIAMMMFAISINSMVWAFTHLIIHAMFKSTMFLCAGIMIHNSNYQDMRMMGMNMINSPLTNSIMGLCSMSLMGLPFMSGYFSKDAIIEFMLSSNFKNSLSLLMILSISLTSLYSIRMIIMSNKFILKTKPETNSYLELNFFIPIIIMSSSSIFMGSSLSWVLSPEQIMIFPNYMKYYILTALLMGVLISISLSFKKKNYILLGYKSKLLWFIHSSTSFLMTLSSPLSSLSLSIDKQWNEIYGPYMLNKTITKISNTPMILNYYSSMLFIIMIMLIPFILLS